MSMYRIPEGYKERARTCVCVHTHTPLGSQPCLKGWEAMVSLTPLTLQPQFMVSPLWVCMRGCGFHSHQCKLPKAADLRNSSYTILVPSGTDA